MPRSTLLLLTALLLAGCRFAAAPEAEPVPEAVSIGWEVTAEAPGTYDEPRFSLALALTGGTEQALDLGTYSGSFADGRESPVVAVDDALLTGASWWAGAGDEFYVLQAAAGGLEVYHRVVEEEVEPGEFTLLGTIQVPSGADIEVAPLAEATNP